MFSESDSVNCVVVDYGIIHGIPVFEPLIYDNNACDSGVKCPVRAGVTNSYSTDIYIEEEFPQVLQCPHF